MSLETILKTISASGEAEILEICRETEEKIMAFQAQAEVDAAERKKFAREAILFPVSGERARQIHQAKLEALQIVGLARERIVSKTLNDVRQYLIEIHKDPVYPDILRRLTEEAIKAVGEKELNGELATSNEHAELMVNPRDEEIMKQILEDQHFKLTLIPSLDNWGGVVVRSGDGRIIVTNTLESCFERATPYLRQELAAFFECQRPLTESEEISNRDPDKRVLAFSL